MNKYIENLVEQLNQLRDLNQQLLQNLTAQQRAMRNGQVSSLQSCNARSQFLADRIRQSEDQVRRASGEIASQLDGDVIVAGNLNLGDLAEHLGEPARSRILALASLIRNLAQQIQQVNQTNQAVTEEVLNCFDLIKRRFGESQGHTALYDQQGDAVMIGEVKVLDAVG